MKVALISLEPWNEVWRRNQYLASELVRLGLVRELVFVEPLTRRPSTAERATEPMPGVRVVAPATRLPRSLGGLRRAGRALRREYLGDVDLLWVNDPALGVYCLADAVPTVYDVTDDWRTAGFPARIVRRIVSAEDRLAGNTRTVVCSLVLQDRWGERYGVRPPVVHNGVDAALWRGAEARPLPGPGPHVGYVGTLHEHRLDLDLVVGLAEAKEVGTLHLVGPNHLPGPVTARLERLPRLRVHGPVPAGEVPSWMLAMDLLVSPHRVSSFTLSLDAIKAYEYAAAGRPVVATPTSGFFPRDRAVVVGPERFVAACCEALSRQNDAERAAVQPALDDASWERRARQFWSMLWPQSPTSIEETTHA